MIDLTVPFVEKISKDFFGINGKAVKLYGEADQNFRLDGDSARFLLKISPPGASVDFLKYQNCLLEHIGPKIEGLILPKVVKNISGEDITEIKIGYDIYYTRLLTWVPGRLFCDVNPHTPDILEDLGKGLGKLTKGLRGFKHPMAERPFNWDVSQADWVSGKEDLFEDKNKKKLFRYFYKLFQKSGPVLPTLRKSVVYNDANDHNIIVGGTTMAPEVAGFIDFGDAVYTHTVNELAIALAYACMGKEAPLDTAFHMVKGFHQENKLKEEELEVLFALTTTRLLLTVTHAAINRQAHPGNEYLSVSERPAWDLLEKFRSVHPSYAEMTFRHACGMPPCKKSVAFRQWARGKKFPFILDIGPEKKKIEPLDLSVGSSLLGSRSENLGPGKFERLLRAILEERDAVAGFGGYSEVRTIYDSPTFEEKGNNGKEWRTVHLGTDVWTYAKHHVRAPLDGKVFSVKNNNGKGNYGPTLILEHHVDKGLNFYTLYGHLDSGLLKRYKTGNIIKAGDVLGSPGSPKENGGWPPHLHFQIILDMLDNTGDFPGACRFDHKETWMSLCPDPGPLAGMGLVRKKKDHDPETLLKRRRELLGPNLSVSYKSPLYIRRGHMQYLYDHTGRRYLDTVNNVAHVGHEHPRIVSSIRKQAGVLNTNTRYLHENILEYSEKLLKYFPPSLNRCFFVNSGSEANELALRMARAHTGNKDMIAVETGYHGNTTNCIDVSSYKFDGKGGKGRPAHTWVVSMPDIYRGEFRDLTTAGRDYAQQVQVNIDAMGQQYISPAAFICEGVLSCGGQIPLPEGYLSLVYEQVRKVGGVCIADEVQTGFGRVGEKFWGFELQGEVPDIVTLGKPIGNGHPLGAVITTDAIAENFANGMEYFNTYGGNPVSCAVGLEVLKVIEDERLQENALLTGNYFKEQLTSLQDKFPMIGNVRGHGLFLGMELIEDVEKRTPATRQAAYFAERMRENGVLTSTDGRDENVIKIKPPMCIVKEDVDYFLERMEVVMGEATNIISA